MSSPEIAAALASLPAMSRLSVDERAALARDFVPRSFEPGDVILRADGPGTSVHLVLEGDVVVSAASGMELAHASAGSLIGAVAFMLRVPRTATCTAATAVRTAELDESVADLLFTVDPAIGVAVELALGAQLGHDFRAVAAALSNLA